LTGGVAEAYSDDSRGRIRHFIVGQSHHDDHTEFARRVTDPLTSGGPFPFVIAIIPAYNEQDSIQRTLRGLMNQTSRPDEIIVLADNCTDNTVSLALAEGVTVVESVGNADGKAGALNGLLATILPLLDFDDTILVMDADTVLTERFIEASVRMLFTPSKKEIAGVGGIFLADDEDEWNLARQLQSNEYVRYQRRLSRRRGRALVLTGTGTVFKAGVLLEVQTARREGRLPDLGQTQSVYDTSALTEDNELTLSVKELGYRVVSPKECIVKTAMMPSFTSLYKQRRRWQRGAMENLIAHGLNRHTLPYALRQMLTYLGVIFLPFYIFTLAIALGTKSSIDFLNPLWVGVAVLYVFEQTFSVRKGGWRAVLVSLAIVPELLLNMFLNIVYINAFVGTLFATNEAWGRMRHLDLAEFDKNGKPRTATIPKPLTLHGTHVLRKGFWARVIEVGAAVLVAVSTLAIVMIPLVSLQAAWNIISVYVLIGALATLGRLIPVKTF
jgi:cellulose synthase/poly-beta-1,6-N-acetylglucosamine synthase-like glycosyltransferase